MLSIQISRTHPIHPSVWLKADVEAGGEEEARVPMVDNHDVEDDLGHSEGVWERRSRLRSLEEREHSVHSENSVQPQDHRTGNLRINMNILNRERSADFKSFQLPHRRWQGTYNCRASSYPDFIQNYFLFLPLSLSHFLPFPPWVSSSSNPGFQDCAIDGSLLGGTGSLTQCVSIGRYWLVLKAVATPVPESKSNPIHLVVLSQYMAVRVGTWWCWAILGGTRSYFGEYHC